MKGGERIDVEYRYQLLTNGPEVTAISLDGVTVETMNGDLYEVQTHFSENEHFDKKNLKKPFLDPDGHFKFPHLWPVKFPQAGRLNYQSFGLTDSCLLSW